MGDERDAFLDQFLKDETAKDPEVVRFQMHRPTRSDLELEEDLAADTNEYFVNPAAAACYNQMVGQMVFQTTNQLVISMGSQVMCPFWG